MAIQHETRHIPDIQRRLDDIQSNDEARRVAEWLTRMDFSVQQRDLSSSRQKDTCKWFLESKEFTDWENAVTPTLFCPGMPGARKTFISSLLIDHLSQTYQDNNIGLAYLYCNYKLKEEQTIVRLMSSLLKQLLGQGQPVPDSLLKKYKSNSALTTDDISAALTDTIKSYDKVFVVIDALDEFQDARLLLTKFGSVLSNINVSNNHRLLGMVTCCPIPEIAEHFRGCSTIEIRALDSDINTYLEHQSPLCLPGWKEDEEFKHLIREKVAESVDGM